MKIFVVGHKSPDLDSAASAFEYAEFLTKSKRYENADVVPARVGDINTETKFVFEKFGAQIPEELNNFEIGKMDRVVLVDHNEETQRAKTVPNDQILEIVDHHKVKVDFPTPVRIDIRPLGCTSTMIYALFKSHEIEPSKETDSLMLASILSDTQGLKSSTTTGVDATAAHALAKKLGIDEKELTFEIFKAKSDLTGLKPLEIARRDFKVFDFGGTPVFINQVEVVEPKKVLAMKDELIDALEKAKSQEQAKLGFLVVTDILNVNSKIIFSTDKERGVLEDAFDAKFEDHIADVGAKMSRKKDIAPAIEKVL